MIHSITLLAAEGGEHKPPNPLLPQWYDIIWSLVAFAVVGFVFWKFVVPRFQKVLDERQNTIEGGIERAEKAQAEANQQLEAYRKQLADARTEAAQIREDARTQGQQIITDMKVKAQEESDRIVENGNQQLAAQRQQVVSELRSDLGKTSVTLAEKLVGSSLSDDAKRSGTVDRFLAELDESDAKARK